MELSKGWTPPKKRRVLWERTKGMAVGRPKKKGVARYKNGAITHKARQEDIMSVAVSQRMRLGLMEEAAKSDLAGFWVGRCHQQGTLQKHHLEAAERYHADMERWIALNGIGRGTARTSSLSEWIGGMSVSGEPDPEVIHKAKMAVHEAQGAICRHMPVEGRRVVNLLNQVIVRDEAPTTATEAFLGVLREALNLLARHYRVPF